MYGVAPDKGKQNGLVWRYSESFAKFMSNLRANKVIRGGLGKELTPGAGNHPRNHLNGTLAPLHKRASDYWIASLGPLGIQPHVGGRNYKFYRDVVADYGADNTDESDASEVINAAVEDGNRCGLECGNTFMQGAIIYFPPGTYKICSPVVQLYYSQFIGDPHDPPTIKRFKSFNGIALFDDDPYIPGGENLVFNMPEATDDETTTANGSGGFVADLQYTARNLKFNGCLTAVQMIWDWGFNWKGIEVKDSAIAFNISGRGGATGQGVGSISVIDSSITNTPIGILTDSHKQSPNIVLNNVKISNVAQVVQVDNGPSLLSGTSDTTTIDLWAHGRRYNGDKGASETGPIKAASKAAGLLGENKRLFTKSRPQYTDFSLENFHVATKESIKNDGTGDQTLTINAFLLKAKANSKIAYFPADVYRVGGTVFIPTGSRVVGSSWSQIQGSGFYFDDMNAPDDGDVETMEITDMLFTVKGATADAILVEWNVAANEQGAAGMWDSHVRVGGGVGTDLDIDNCLKGDLSDRCLCASMLLHVTAQISGYFENVWVWVADHDNDMVVYNSPDKLINQISLYAHCVIYQYQLHKAKNVYLGHIQSETPCYQPNPVAPYPFDGARPMAADPSFVECTTDSCKAGWGLRIIDSENIAIHGSRLYSLFRDYYQDCLNTFDCEERILEVKGSKNVAIFNLFTVGTVNIALVTPISLGMTLTNGKFIANKDKVIVSVWLPLDGSDNINVVYVGPEIWDRPTVACSPPCVLALPTSTLGQDTTISLEYGHHDSSTGPGGQVITIFYTTTTTITITVPLITIPRASGLPYSNVNIARGQPGGGFIATPRVEIPRIGGTTARQVSLPPWPDVNRAPPEDWDYKGPWGTPSPIPSGGTYQCPPSSEIFFNTPRMTLTVDCHTPAFKFGFSCPTTKVVTFLGASAGVFTVGCTVTSVWDFPRSQEPTPAPSKLSTSDGPLPAWTTWPPGEIRPVEREVEKSEPEDGDTVTPCTLWFFFVCIHWDNIKIGGEPPPPFIKSPFRIGGTLPPWPEITIGRDRKLTYSNEPTSCTAKSASLCTTTTIFSVTKIADDSTRTAATATSRQCETARGCDLTDRNTRTEPTAVESCAPTPRVKARDDDDNSRQRVWQNAIVYPKDPKNVGDIPSLLNAYAGRYETIGVPEFSVVGYYWVPLMDAETMKRLKGSAFVSDAYYYQDWNKAGNGPDRSDNINGEMALPAGHDDGRDDDGWTSLASPLFKKGPFWAASVVSLPKGMNWREKDTDSYDDSNLAAPYLYQWDDQGGDNQHTIYLTGETRVWADHSEFKASEGFQGKLDIVLPGGKYDVNNDKADAFHGTCVAAYTLGAKLGICKKCRGVWLETKLWSVDDPYFNENFVRERGIAHLMISQYPGRFASPDDTRNPHGYLKNLIVVGATQNIGIEYTNGQTSQHMTTFAPGENIQCPSDPSAGGDDKYARKTESGTSVAAPQKMIRLFDQRYGFWNAQRQKNFGIMAGSKPVIWNGQVKDKNSFLDYDTRATRDTTKSCPDIPDDLGTTPGNPGEPVNCNNPPSAPNSRRQAGGGGSCPLNLGGSGAENNCGGKLCTGFFCRPKPSGISPDYMDPKDPNAGNPVPTTHIPGPNKPTTTRGGGTIPTPSPECDDNGSCQWQYTTGGGGLEPNPVDEPDSGANRMSPPNSNGLITENPYHVDAVYEIYSSRNGNGGFVVSGFGGDVNGTAVGVGVVKPDWVLESNGTVLQTRYKGLGMEKPGTMVGSLTCDGYAPAACFRGNPDKGGLDQEVREELVCRWE
ncbi:family 55 putative glycoside hydrolase [Triangularia setosa]|uniref:Family 55 putative glycoside hydrolase n=1 Tax=Triangularia setosa TaxID=2587417 RepID=A0AAN6WG80_9PEZI|nr:family 55 putative glycoside hydrolase [Podospora setosa]